MSGFEAATEIRDIENKLQLKIQERHFICGLSADISESKFLITFKYYSCSIEMQRVCNRHCCNESHRNGRPLETTAPTQTKMIQSIITYLHYLQN